jgi:WD40 repeat protein
MKTDFDLSSPPVKITTSNVTRISSLNVLRGHSGMIFSTAFNLHDSSPPVVASASGDCDIRLWPLDPSQPEVVLDGHSEWTPCVAFSPDGLMVASAGKDATIRLWDIGTRECVSVYNHPDGCTGVAFSPDGTQIATACDDHSVRIWSTESSTCLLEMGQHEKAVYCVQWSPSGVYLASAGEEPRVRLWDAVSGECIFSLQGHTSWIWNLSFTPDSTILASSSGDTTGRLWDVNNGGTIAILDCERVNPSVAISPDGSFLVSGALDLLHVWDIATVTRLHTIRFIGGQRVEGVSLSKDQTKIAFGWGDDVHLYGLSDGRC